MRIVAVAVLSLFLLNGCAGAVLGSPSLAGAGQSQYNISANDVIGKQVGRACAQSVLGLINWGDATVRNAVINGGIRKISLVDRETLNLLVYAKACTVVTGD